MEIIIIVNKYKKMCFNVIQMYEYIKNKHLITVLPSEMVKCNYLRI